MRPPTYFPLIVLAGLPLIGCGDSPSPSATGMEGKRAGEAREIGGIAMVWCPSGKFDMGSPAPWVLEVSDWLFVFGGEEGHSDVETRHRVSLTRGFWIAKTETTQAQWEAMMGGNPGHFKGGGLPVEKVSWKDVQQWLEKMNLEHPLPDGWRWDLPTEAQWEYACRAGRGGEYGGWKLDEVGWYDRNSGGRTHPVGGKRANDWGIHDMHGNVREWCRDWFDVYAAGSAGDPSGPAAGLVRVHRGGSWKNADVHGRAAYRNNDTPGTRLHNLGFRAVVVPRS